MVCYNTIIKMTILRIKNSKGYFCSQSNLRMIIIFGKEDYNEKQKIIMWIDMCGAFGGTGGCIGRLCECEFDCKQCTGIWR